MVLSTSVVLALLAIAWGGDIESAPGGDTQATDTFNQKYQESTEALEDTWNGIYRLVAIASNDFQVDLTDPSNVDLEVAGEFDEELLGTLQDSARALLTSREALAAAEELPPETACKFKGTNVAFAISDGGDVTITDEGKPILFTTAVLVAGIAITAYGACKGVSSAYDRRAQAGLAIIDKSSGAELREINKSMGIDPNLSKDAAKQKLNSLGLKDKLTAVKNIEAINRDPDIGTFSGADDTRKSIANGAVELGKTAVTTTVGACTTATGGQGMDKLAGAVGVPEGAAALVDLGISAAGKQPLDHLANHCDITVTSKDREEKDIPKSPLSTEDAEKIVNNVADGKLNDVTSTTDLKNAGDTLAGDTARHHGDALDTKDKGDKLTVNVPEQTHVQGVDNVRNGDTIKIPNPGGKDKADIMVTTPGNPPTVKTDVDLTTKGGVTVEVLPPKSGDGERTSEGKGCKGCFDDRDDSNYSLPEPPAEPLAGTDITTGELTDPSTGNPVKVEDSEVRRTQLGKGEKPPVEPGGNHCH